MWRLAPRAPRRLGQPWAKLGLIPHGRPKAQPHGGCHWMLDSNPSAPDDDLVSPARGGAGPPTAGKAPFPRPARPPSPPPPSLSSRRARSPARSRDRLRQGRRFAAPGHGVSHRLRTHPLPPESAGAIARTPVLRQGGLACWCRPPPGTALRASPGPRVPAHGRRLGRRPRAQATAFRVEGPSRVTGPAPRDP